MAQLDTLGVTSGTTSVTDDVDILGFRSRAWAACFFANIDHRLKSVK